MSELSPIEPLTSSHDRSSFECEEEALTNWLRTVAGQAQKADTARTFVVHREDRVVGYYSLAMSSVSREVPPAEWTKRFPLYPVGAVLLARLAVDKSEIGNGLGAALLMDALYRGLGAAEAVAAPFFMVDAISDRAAGFYRHFGFKPAPENPLKLFLRVADIRLTAERAHESPGSARS